jgi:type I restriction enzyme, S subunit
MSRSSHWGHCTLRELLAEDFPGAWGQNPGPQPPNATVLRSTNLDDDGHVDIASGAPRVLPGRDLLSKRLIEGDILLEASGGGPGKPVGRVALFKDPGDRIYACSNFFRTLRPNQLVDAAYLSWYLRWSYRQPLIWRFQQQTTGITNLEHHDYLRQTVPLPQKDEQRRISEILDTIDNAIRSSERLIAKLDLTKQGLLNNLLTRGIDKNGALRDLRIHPEQFVDTPLGMIPRDWLMAPCRDLCREIVVGIVIRPTQWYASSGVPVLRSANVREDGIDMSDLMFMTVPHHRVLSKSAVVPGDVVTVRTGYPGTTAVIPDSVAEANCVDIIISRPGPRILPQYLSTWVNAPVGKGQVLAKQGGLAQQHFNVGEMKELLVAVPPLNEQRAICACATAIQRRVQDERTLLEKLRLLQSGLMEDLLTGRVRVDEDTA